MDTGLKTGFDAMRLAATMALAYRKDVAATARSPTEGYDTIISAFEHRLPEDGADAVAIIEELVEYATPGIRAMTGPRSPCFEFAYPVPFQLHRDIGPRRYLLTNRGSETLDGVMVSLLGAGVMPATTPSTLHPGEGLEVVIAARDLARDTLLVVRWFRPSGEEFLWRVSF